MTFDAMFCCQYYKRLFPYSQYARWLQYGNVDKNYMANRELSFTLADDIYIRYLSFTGAEDLEAEMIKRFNLPPIFPTPHPSLSFSLQCVGVPTRLTLVQCTTLDQVITRN